MQVHERTVALLRELNNAVSLLTANLSEPDQSKQDAAYDAICKDLMHHCTIREMDSPDEELEEVRIPKKKRKSNANDDIRRPSKKSKPAVVGEMTHRDSCASVGLNPSPRGINKLPNGGLFLQCQTEEKTIYEDMHYDEFYYDFAAIRQKMIHHPDDLKPGTVNHFVFEQFNKHGGIHVIAAFGGKNKWYHEVRVLSGFTMVDGLFKMVCSRLNVPRPISEKKQLM